MENNQILDTIRSRKSVREFTDQTIEDTTISNILEAGRQAPSGLNNQPWCFIIVRDKITLNSIAKCTKYSSIIHGTPLLIVVMLDKNVMYDLTKDTQACGAAIENMLLAAHGMSLGAVWLGEILNKKEDVSHILEVPDSFELMAVIAIGHPVSDISHPKGRRELSKIAHNEKFGIPWV